MLAATIYIGFISPTPEERTTSSRRSLPNKGMGLAISENLLVNQFIHVGVKLKPR